MAKALALVADYEYQSDKDPDEVKTTWILRSLTSFEFMQCCGNGVVDDAMFVRTGLVGWRDFVDAAGEEIEFSVENMGRIPPLIVQDLSFKIQNISVLSEDDRKN